MPEEVKWMFPQSVMGAAAANFYIQLIDIPKGGSLYSGRTAGKNGVICCRRDKGDVIDADSPRPAGQVEPDVVGGNRLACRYRRAARGETIGGLTYVPGTAASETIRYVASSTQGKPLFAGNIHFTSSGIPTVSNLYGPERFTSRVPVRVPWAVNFRVI